MLKKKQTKKTVNKKNKTVEIGGYYWDGAKTYVLKRAKNILGI
jgi:hypothetical protein